MYEAEQMSMSMDFCFQTENSKDSECKVDTRQLL